MNRDFPKKRRRLPALEPKPAGNVKWDGFADRFRRIVGSPPEKTVPSPFEGSKYDKDDENEED